MRVYYLPPEQTLEADLELKKEKRKMTIFEEAKMSSESMWGTLQTGFRFPVFSPGMFQNNITVKVNFDKAEFSCFD